MAESLYDAAAMRALDRWAIDDRGVPGLELMEAAGRGLAEFVAELAPGGRVAVVCGAGNNGGDGYVAARLLRTWGREVDVLMATPAPPAAGDAATNARRLPGAPAVPWDPALLDGAAVIVDCLLGTGASGAPREPFASIIDAINATGVPVVAADLPSGVDAGTGEVAGSAIRAAATATFAAAKAGLWIAPAKQHAGDVRVIELPYPDRWPVQPSARLLGADALAHFPRRGAASTKFTSGHVLVAGGSRGLSGAPCLAAAAAIRTGAGYVTACVPAGLLQIVETRLAEVMCAPLPGPETHQGPENVAMIIERAELHGGALVLGPGLGREPAAAAFARELAVAAEVPLVLDADGLNAYAGALAALAQRGRPTVLTPHAGELARLLGCSSEEVARARLDHARRAASAAGAVVVLKGDDTLVVTPDAGAPFAISTGDAPALATAGTGDVLAGMIGALLGAGMTATRAAEAAVFLHAAAGRAAAVSAGTADVVIASDVVAELGPVLARERP